MSDHGPFDTSDLRLSLQERSTEELADILRDRDEDEWRPEVFEIVASILGARGWRATDDVASTGTDGQAATPAVVDFPSGNDDELVVAGRYLSHTEAHLGRMTLESAGISAWVFDDVGGNLFLPAGGSTLKVRASDAAAAAALLTDDSSGGAAAETEAEDPSSPPPTEALEGGGEPPTDSAPTSAPASVLPLDGTSRRIEVLELAGVLLAAVVYPIVTGHLMSKPGSSEAPISPSWLMVDALRSAGLALVVATLLRTRPGAIPVAALPRDARAWLREIGAGILIFLALWVVVEPTVALLLHRLGVPNGPMQSAWEVFFRAPDGRNSYLVGLVFVVVYEELVFRAFLITRLATLLGNHHVWIVVVAAGLFALAHGYPTGDTLQVFATGLLWGAVFVRRRSLPRLVVSHCILDFEIMLLYMRGSGS